MVPCKLPAQLWESIKSKARQNYKCRPYKIQPANTQSILGCTVYPCSRHSVQWTRHCGTAEYMWRWHGLRHGCRWWLNHAILDEIGIFNLIFKRVVNPDKGTYVFTALSTRPYQHFIKNLNPDNAYHIRILAYNAVGPGDYCSNSGFDCDGSALSMPQNW